MTDWDARAEELAKEKEARSERLRQESMAAVSANREKAEEIRSKLHDVTNWAIGRYQAARIQLLPVYVEWEEEVKPLFKKAHKEGHKIQIGQLYPLRKYYWYWDEENSSGYYIHDMWAATADMRIFDIRLGRGEFPKVMEITRQRKMDSENWEQLGTYFSLVEQYPLTEQGSLIGYGRFLGSEGQRLEIDAVCDDIVEYVKSHSDPINPPTFF
jgi:hypothetical protein